MGPGRTVLAIGHPADRRDQPQDAAVARIGMRGGEPTLPGRADRGFIGAPAFAAFPDSASRDPGELLLKCIGVVPPGDAELPAEAMHAGPRIPALASLSRVRQSAALAADTLLTLLQ